MIIPEGNGSKIGSCRKNAENFLEILAKEYEAAIIRNLIRGGGNTRWILESGNIFEIVGERKNLLSYYDVTAFLIAILHLEGEFMENNEEEEFWGVFHDSGFFSVIGGPERYYIDNIVHNIGRDHKKLIPKLLSFPERLSILRELYISLKSEDVCESDELLQRDMLLGMVMIQFLKLGIRPYMLENDRDCRTKILSEGRDWVYELSELFHDFSNDQFYHMGGFGQMYESIKYQALQLQERKEKKLANIRYVSSVATEDIFPDEGHREYIKHQVSRILIQTKVQVDKNERIVADLLQRIMN